MVNGIVRVMSKKKLLAVIIRAKFKQKGIKFFVPDEYPQQIACMRRPRGYVISSHIHKPVLRKIKFAQETLFVRSGKIRIDFYDEKKCYIESRIARQGDVVFLAFGGHGFEFMEDAEVIEIKQGPFLIEAAPAKFEPVVKDKIRLKK